MTAMLQFDEPAPLIVALSAVRAEGRRIGLVPTMGNLHAGHLALLEAARKHSDFVLATVFVNPLQFGPHEDLARYPRTFDADKVALAGAGCDAVFAPAVSAIYPDGVDAHTRISVPGVSELHCGASRPGHFDGVCTVVCKLFNLIRPDAAFFGLKDYQQFHIISRMVDDLQIPVRLHGIATVRERSGLALSSRNGFLSADQHEAAAALYKTLQDCAGDIETGHADWRALEQQACAALMDAGLRPDYVHICRRDNLQPANPGDRHLVILAAAYAGSTRLIDNTFVLTAA